jgi:hypothetical protein
MIDSIGVVLRLLLEFLGASSVTELGALAFAGAAVAAVILAAVVFVAALHVSSAPERAAPHPRRAIDVSTRLDQSHPDAPGHSRPRAPGIAATAA